MHVRTSSPQDYLNVILLYYGLLEGDTRGLTPHRDTPPRVHTRTWQV